MQKPSYTLTEAAKVTGMSRSTLARAASTGKLETFKGEEDNLIRVDHNELARCYPDKLKPTKPEKKEEQQSLFDEKAIQLETLRDRLLQRDKEIAYLKERIQELEASVQQKVSTVTDFVTSKGESVKVYLGGALGRIFKR